MACMQHQSCGEGLTGRYQGHAQLCGTVYKDMCGGAAVVCGCPALFWWWGIHGRSVCAGEHGVGVRVVDFGGSFSATETDTRRVVFEVQTLQYRAPEVRIGPAP